ICSICETSRRYASSADQSPDRAFEMFFICAGSDHMARGFAQSSRQNSSMDGWKRSAAPKTWDGAEPTLPFSPAQSMRFATILLPSAACVLAEAQKNPSPPEPSPNPPVAGQPFDDREVLSHFENEGRRLYDAGRIKPLKSA